MINNSQPAPATRDGDVQREILHVLRGILKQLPPRYSLTVGWNHPPRKGYSMSFFPKLIDPTLVVGQSSIGVVTETETQNGVTSPFPVVPANITAVPADPTIVSATVDPATGNVTVIGLSAGTTSVVVSDTANAAAGATATYSFTVTAAAPTFALNVAFAAPTA